MERDAAVWSPQRDSLAGTPCGVLYKYVLYCESVFGHIIVLSPAIMTTSDSTQSSAAYGVLYKPSQTASFASVDDLRLEQRGIKYVRVQWVDFTNLVRFRVLPVSYFKRLFTSSRPGIGLAYATLGMVGAMMAPGFLGTGEYIYSLDLSSFRVCPYAPGHAVVMGWFEEKTPSPSGSLSSPLCPRAVLKRIVECVPSSS